MKGTSNIQAILYSDLSSSAVKGNPRLLGWQHAVKDTAAFAAGNRPFEVAVVVGKLTALVAFDLSLEPVDIQAVDIPS